MSYWKHVSMACMTVLAAAAGVGAAAVAAGADYAASDPVVADG